jgi:hypothetical protein
MAILRKQYITVIELNEILNSVYADNATTNQLIIEASELISYHTVGKSDYVTVDPQLNYLKLATAYQVSFSEDAIDEYEVVGDSFGLGRLSQSNGGASNDRASEWKKISPKANQYLSLACLLYKGCDYRNV